MKPYMVTIIRDGRRHTVKTMSLSWYDAWEATISEFGIPAVIVVKPA